ncbi:MAG: UDP-N-acetylmuramate dehydrogenase [Nitrospiraceae bacterium]|nr:UDP-N-acetylmuramate dehydrogenase [Nitrospiraceae bacterium]
MPSGGLGKAGGLIKELRLEGTEIRLREPLKGHTSLGIGGRAEVYARPGDTGALARLLAFDWQMPVCFLGGGTNLLVRDGEIRALFISTAGLRGIEVLERGEKGAGAVISVRAGEPLKSVLAFCMKNGFSGLEPLAGIPGSLGGAVAGNAGAHGLEIGDVIRRVHVMGEKGGTMALTGEQMGFVYRGAAALAGPSGGPSKGPSRGRGASGLVIKAELALDRTDPAEIRALMLRNFGMKKKTQPLGARSAGCVFKNPGGRSAGSLIDEAGLKGMRAGDIEVSGLHANFFINRGEGSADDFLRLMDRVADEVEKRFGVRLAPEIRIFRDGFER